VYFFINHVKNSYKNFYLNFQFNTESLNKMDSEYPLFFYEELVSLNIVEPDTYYEEGIMNS